MSSLWTPDGERRVTPSAPTARPAPDPTDNASGSGLPPGDRDDDEIDPELLAEATELEERLLDAPVEDVIANHCYGLFQLAALHLGQRPPSLESARLAIDALRGVIDGLGDRLGDAAPTLRDGLAQLQLAFVQIAGASRAVDGDASALGDDS
jgi:hypothetical protein